MKSCVRCSIGALLFAALLPLMSCGGGGAPGGGGGGITVTISPTTVTVGLNGTVLFSVTVTGATDPSVTWSATQGTIVPTGATSAQYTAPGFATTATVRVTSVQDPTKFREATVTVAVGTSTVTGRVVRDGSSSGIAGVIVDFFDGGGTLLTSATTNSTGNFSRAVPLDAVRFHLRNSSVPTGYYKAYEYNAKRYSTLITTCSAPLPALVENGTVPLATTVEVPPTSLPPPPPPNGCQ